MKHQTSLPAQSTTVFACTKHELMTRWAVFADADHGGQSTATLRMQYARTPASQQGTECIQLSGTLCPTSANNQQKSWGVNNASPASAQSYLAAGGMKAGYAGMRSYENAGYLPTDECDTLSLRVRGDGRTYIVSLKADSFIKPSSANFDLWQAPLHTHARGTDEEFDVEKIALSRFVLTHKGKVLDHSSPIDPSRFVSMSIGVTGLAEYSPPGPFRLELAGVFAHDSSRGPLSEEVLYGHAHSSS